MEGENVNSNTIEQYGFNLIFLFLPWSCSEYAVSSSFTSSLLIPSGAAGVGTFLIQSDILRRLWVPSSS